MANSVLYMSMSLDGFIAGPDDGPGNGGTEVLVPLALCLGIRAQESGRTHRPDIASSVFTHCNFSED